MIGGSFHIMYGSWRDPAEPRLGRWKCAYHHVPRDLKFRIKFCGPHLWATLLPGMVRTAPFSGIPLVLEPLIHGIQHG